MLRDPTKGVSFGKVTALPEVPYPNPFIDHVTIYYPTAEQSDVQLQITDVTGALAYDATHNVAGDAIYHITLDISRRSAGIYFLKVKQGEKTEYVKLLRSE